MVEDDEKNQKVRGCSRFKYRRMPQIVSYSKLTNERGPWIPDCVTVYLPFIYIPVMNIQELDY